MRLVMLVCIVFFSSFLYAQQNEFMDINDLIKEGKYEQAIKILSSKEVEISSNPKVGYYLGICYFKTKNYELAEEYFEKAYKNGHITSNLLYNLGVTKYKLKKYKEAIEVLEKTKTDKLIYDKSLYLMIAANLKLRDKKSAINLYKELRETYPYSINLLKAQDLLEKYGIDHKKYDKKNFAGYLYGSYGYDTNINYAAEEYYNLVGLKDYSYFIYFSILFFDETYSISLGSMLKNYITHTEYNFKNFFSSFKITLIPSYDVSLTFFGNYYIEEEPLQKSYGLKLRSKFYIDELVLEPSLGYSFEDYFNFNYQVLNGPIQDYSLSSKLGVLQANVGYKIKSAESNDYSYNTLYYGAKLEKRFKTVLISFGGNISNKKYNSRNDKITSIFANFAIKITNQAELNINYTYTYSNSSNTMYTYKTQSYFSGLSLYF